MRTAGPTRRGAGIAAAVITVVLLGGCTAHQEPAAPNERGEPHAGSGGAAHSSSAAPLPLPQPAPSTPLVRPGAGLDEQDRGKLAEAQRIGAQWVVLTVATAPGQTQEAAKGLASLGGVLGTTNPAPGYLRVTMPVSQVERASTLPGVTAVDVSDVIPPNQPRTNGTR